VRWSRPEVSAGIGAARRAGRRAPAGRGGARRAHV